MNLIRCQAVPGLLITLVILALAGCTGESSAPADGPSGGQDAVMEGLGFPDLRPHDPDTKLPPVDAAADGTTPTTDGSVTPEGSVTPDGPVATGVLKNVTLLVNIGDSLAAGYYATSGNSYKALLVNNNNLLYPTHAGKDLSSLFPGLKVVDKSKSGAKTAEILKQAKSVAGNPVGNTLVLISAGGNDFNENMTTMLLPLQAALAASANLGQIAAHFNDKLRFPGTSTLVMLNVHDPTDGAGKIPNIKGLGGFCKTILKFGLVGGIVVTNLGLFNGHLATAASTNKMLLVDNHKAFLGHGFNFADKTNVHYVAKDPSLWFHTDCAHGNNRGHHELRKLIWSKLGLK